MLVDGEKTHLTTKVRRRKRAVGHGIARPPPVRGWSVLHEASRDAAPVFVGSFAEWQEKVFRDPRRSRRRRGGYRRRRRLPLLADASVFGCGRFRFTCRSLCDEYAALGRRRSHCPSLARAALYETAGAAEGAEASQSSRMIFSPHIARAPHAAHAAGAGPAMLPQRFRRGRSHSGRSSHLQQRTRQSRLIESCSRSPGMVDGRARSRPADGDLGETQGAGEEMMPGGGCRERGPSSDSRAGTSTGGCPDPRRRERSFGNCFRNAVKFTPPAATIAVHAEVFGESATCVGGIRCGDRARILPPSSGALPAGRPRPDTKRRQPRVGPVPSPASS